MTVAVTARKVGPTPGNSLATVFPFAFKVFVASDLLVQLTTIATGAVSTLVLNDPLGYTVALNPDQNAAPGGSVTYNPLGVPMPATQALTIISQVPESQGLHINNGGAFFANNVEDAVDRAMIAVQDLAVKVNSSLQFPVVDGPLTSTLPAAAQRANQALLFDGSGNVIAGGVATAPVSAPWQPVVAAASLALGRAAMGFSAYFDSLIAAATAAAMRALLLIDGTSRVLKAGDMGDSMMGFSLINGTLVPSQNGTVLTVAVKTLAGADPSAADPVYVVFRNVAAATGDYAPIKLVAATSISTVVGGTFGVANAIPFRLWVVGFNDGGVFRLGLINCLTTVAGAGSGRDVAAIFPLAQFSIASSTQIGAGSTSAGVFYTAGAAVASKAYAVLGYLTYEAGLAAAGTFGINQSRTDLFRAGMPLPGQILQVARSDTGVGANGTTVIPYDDTIPQSGEGDQYMSVSLTPGSAANVLDVSAQGFWATSVASPTGAMTAALFQDAVANALKIGLVLNVSGNNAEPPTPLRHVMQSGLSVSTTFKVRAGLNAAGTTYFNGNSGGRLMGGVFNSFIDAREVMA